MIQKRRKLERNSRWYHDDIEEPEMRLRNGTTPRLSTKEATSLLSNSLKEPRRNSSDLVLHEQLRKCSLKDEDIQFLTVYSIMASVIHTQSTHAFI
jgi:hypothetical protein